MASRIKQLNKRKSDLSASPHYNFDVMKPFLKFGAMAMGAIGHTLIAIVKNIPKPHHDTDKPGSKDKIIRI